MIWRNYGIKKASWKEKFQKNPKAKKAAILLNLKNTNIIILIYKKYRIIKNVKMILWKKRGALF